MCVRKISNNDAYIAACTLPNEDQKNEGTGCYSTDTDTITTTENLSLPGNSHSTTGARSVNDAREMLTDDSSAVAYVSPTVGVFQPTILHESLLEL